MADCAFSLFLGLLREKALREAMEVCDDAILAEIFLLEGFPVLEERVDCDDHTDVRGVGRAESGIGVLDDQTFFGGDPEFSGGMQENIRLRFSGEGTVIEDDFVRIEPTIKREGVEIEVDIFFDGRGGNRQRQLALLQIVQHFDQAVRQHELFRFVQAEFAVMFFLLQRKFLHFLVRQFRGNKMTQDFVVRAAVYVCQNLCFCKPVAWTVLLDHVDPGLFVQMRILEHCTVEVKNDAVQFHKLAPSSVWAWVRVTYCE